MYGFITTGESWRMIRYDGTFQMTNKMEVVFDAIEEEKARWMKEFALLIDCMYVALQSGGIVKKDMVVGG